jgi:glycosyltransferase involved in cell wall biosynthesis
MRVFYISEVQWLAQISRKHLLVQRFPPGWETVFTSPVNLTFRENSLHLRTDASHPDVRYISLPLPKPDSLLAPVRAMTGVLSSIGTRSIRKLVGAFEPDVVICSLIWAAPVVPFVRSQGIPVVYDCNDLHPDFYPAREREAWEAFRELTSSADEVVASSSYLRETCGRGIVIGNGVDLDTFRGRTEGPLPDPIAESPLAECDDLVVYVGSLDARIDFDMLEAVAERLDEDERRLGLVCVGRVFDSTRDRAEAIARRFPGSFLFTGQKPYSELPGYLSAGSVGVAPFLLNERTEAVNPNKLYMYSAMDMNVVSTPFSREIRELGDAIRVESEPRAFAEATMEALGDDARRRAIRELVALPNGWDEKAKEFTELLVDLAERS